MSGPKYHFYRVNAEVLAWFEEERQAQIAAAMARRQQGSAAPPSPPWPIERWIRAVYDKLWQVTELMQDWAGEVRAATERDGRVSFVHEDLARLAEQARAVAESVGPEPSKSSGKEAYLRALWQALRTVEQLEDEAAGALKRLRQELQHEEALSCVDAWLAGRHGRAGETAWDTTQQGVRSQASLTVVSAAGEAGQATAAATDVATHLSTPASATAQAAYQEFLETVQPYLQGLTGSDRVAVERLVEAVDRIQAHSRLSDRDKAEHIRVRLRAFRAVQPRYDEALAARRQLLQAYHEARARYLALCELTGRMPEVAEVPPPLVTDEDVKALRAASDHLEAEFARAQEQAYVARVVGEVMQELGYDVIATDILSDAGDAGIHDVYAMNDLCGIHVHTSPEGGVLFEVTGVSEAPRQLTSYERVRIVEGMRAFCERLPQIHERLRSRGITVELREAKPADARYARILAVPRRLGRHSDGNRALRRDVVRHKEGGTL